MYEVFSSLDDRGMSELEGHGKLNDLFLREHHVRIRTLHVDKLETVVDFIDKEFGGESLNVVLGAVVIASDLRLPLK